MRCDVTARDVSSLTRCDEHASDTAAQAVQSPVPGVPGRSWLRSLPKLLRSGGSSPDSQPLGCSAPASCHMLLLSSGAQAVAFTLAPRINPIEGREGVQAELGLP